MKVLAHLAMAYALAIFLSKIAAGEMPALILQDEHAGEVTAAAISRDGRFVATGGEDFTCRLWGVESGFLIESKRTVASGHSGGVDSIAFSPGSETVAVAVTSGFISDGNDPRDRASDIFLWNLNSQVLSKLPRKHGNRINHISIDSSGKYLVSSCEDRLCFVWDIATGRVIAELLHPKGVNSAVFTEHGVATSCWDGNLRFWNIDEPREPIEVEVSPAHGENANFVDLRSSPDGTRLLWVDDSVQMTRNRLSASTAIPLGQSVGAAFLFDDAVFASKGHRLVYQTLADPETLQAPWKGSHLLAARETRGNVVFVDTQIIGAFAIASASTTVVRRIAHKVPRRIRENELSRVSVSKFKGDVIVREAQGSKRSFFRLGHTIEKISGPPWKGRTARSTSTPIRIVEVNNRRRINVYEMGAAKPILKLRGLPRNLAVEPYAISGSGSRVAVGGFNGRVSCWDVDSGEILSLLPIGDGNVYSAVLNKDGSLLFVGKNNGIVETWGVESGSRLRVDGSQSGFLSSIAISNDDSLIATCSSDYVRLFGIHAILPTADASVVVWDVASMAELVRQDVHSGGVNAASFLEVAGKQLLATAGSDGKLAITEVRQSGATKEIQLHSNQIASFCVLPNSDVVSTTSDDGTICFTKIVPAAGNSLGDGDFNLVLVARGSIGPLGEWVFVSGDGRFDAPDVGHPLRFRWRMADQPKATYAAELFLRDLYEPNLLSRLLSGEELPKPRRDLASLNRVQPLVEIVTGPGEDGRAKRVRVVDDVAHVKVRVKATGIERTYGGKQHKTDAYDVRLLRDGQLVWQYPDPKQDLDNVLTIQTDEQLCRWQEAYRITPNTTDGRFTKTIKVPLPHHRDRSKPIEFEAYCFNEDRVKSQTAKAKTALEVPIVDKPREKRAYIITFGVNASENPKLDLKFAAADVRSIQEHFGEALKSASYGMIENISLISDYQQGERGKAGRELPVNNATAENLRDVLLQLAGSDEYDPNKTKLPLGRLRNLPKSTPDDLVLIFASTHGYTSRQTGMFYLYPSNVASWSEKRAAETAMSKPIEESCEQSAGQDDASSAVDAVPAAEPANSASIAQGISSDDLSRWLRDVDAANHVLVLDTCMSQGAIESAGSEFKPGPFGSRGLGQLAYDKAMLVLAASQAEEKAWGDEELKHGVLTYALLHGLGVREDDGQEPQSDADTESAPPAARSDGTLTLSRLFEYAADQVPQIHQNMALSRLPELGLLSAQPVGAISRDPGSALDLSELEPLIPTLKRRIVQRPAIYDFAKRRPAISLKAQTSLSTVP